ncbi:unnamed protein product [Phaeothamnion confervicola]
MAEPGRAQCFPAKSPPFQAAYIGRASMVSAEHLTLESSRIGKLYQAVTDEARPTSQFGGILVRCKEVLRPTQAGTASTPRWIDVDGPSYMMKIACKSLVLARAAIQGREPGNMWGEDPYKEIAVLQLLNEGGGHPHIEKIVDAFEDDKFLYKISLFCDGGDVLAAIPLAETEMQRIAHELLAAVAFCHACGVMHRDISPENILLETRADGVRSVCLIDFGMAVSIPRDETGWPLLLESQHYCGKPSYMAPEVFFEASVDAKAADLFSCGTTLYACLVGVPPWKSVSDRLFCLIAVEGHLASLLRHWNIDHVSPAAADLLQGMLWANPRRRLASYDGIHSHPWFSLTTRCTGEGGTGDDAALAVPQAV